MMNINGITSLPAVSIPATESALQKGAAPAASASFGSIMRGALESLDHQMVGAENEIARAVAGESPDMHRTIATLQTADLSFQLALQVRNKIVGAFEEIMRMQV